METEIKQHEFKGWAVVEIMGHQKVAGFVETVALGATVMFRVSAPEIPPTEQILTERAYINYKTLEPGSKVRISREALCTYVGVASVYRMTPCSEERALAVLGQKVEVIEAVSAALIEGPGDPDNKGDEVPY